MRGLENLGNLIIFMFSPILLALWFIREMWVNNRRLELVLIIFGIIAIYHTMAPPYY